ncbi:Protein priA [Grifola frondosa]|uniref:Protein priA n=1 Tax=Grifola frondosa TaxID=5627 RepID=A0A1C7M2X4_GRIFR|nr:Protein priA [Grifola frondosa]
MNLLSPIHWVEDALICLPNFAVAADTSCPPGSYNSQNGKAPCTLCAPGTWTDQTGQHSCTNAQAGWYATGPGATFQTECSQGTYSTGNAATCTLCPAGSYCNGQGCTAPVLCPPGRYAQLLDPDSNSVTNVLLGLSSTFKVQRRAVIVALGSTTYSPAGSTLSSQCGTTGAGGLTTCAMSGNTCPNTGGSMPSQGSRKRNTPRRLPCAPGHKNCPLYSSSLASKIGFLRGYECVDIENDLESCGGCVSTDSQFGEHSADGGRDCSAIPNVDVVQCRSGKCLIDKCDAGYSVSEDGERCIAVFNLQT